jgi:hypothetical protein
MYGDKSTYQTYNGMQNKTKQTRSISHYHSITVSLIPQSSIILTLIDFIHKSELFIQIISASQEMGNLG